MATVELFSFLGYDQSKKSEILDFLKKKTGKNIPVKRLNDMLEKGEVVEYFNDALTQVDDANKAKYCIIDTGYPSILLTDDGTICVELIKLRNTWTGGFVDLKENLLATNREKERSYGAKSNLSNEIAVAVQEAVHNGATQEKLDEVVAKVKENSEHNASLSNVVSSKLVNTIKDYMLNFGDDWNDASIKQVVGGVLMVAHAELQQGRDTGWLKLNVMKNSVVINSGFIGDDYDYIYLVGDVDANSYITNVNVLDSSAKMVQLGFKDTELPSEILCSKMVGCFELPFTDVSTDDRSKMRHCIVERAYRSESSLKSMTVREIRDRIRLSIEMSLSLQKRGICMVEPIYYIKNQCLAYCIPFYAKADMDISKPDGILLVREISGVYKVCTMLDTYSAYNGVVTLDRYPQAAWLKGMVGTDVLKREVKMDHITEEDEA